MTDPSCPFHTHPYKDVTGALYEAFRKEGLAISTYFSKPDWHCDHYWHRAFGNPPSRDVNYGKIDVLWLDGGWVNPGSSGQDIRLNELIPKLREIHPHLIVCDRTVGGEFENIVTPEKTVPETALSIPWETCTTLGNRFAFTYSDNFKSGHDLVHLLLEIVSKGGNLALNIAPQPDGALPKPAVESLKELGRWLKVFGDGIYETHIVSPYFHDNVKYTAKGDEVYAFYLYDNSVPHLPKELELTCQKSVKTVKSMRTNDFIPFTQNRDKVTLHTTSLSLEDAFYAECFILE